MLAYAIRRVLLAIPVVFGVTVITFAIMHVTAGGHIPGLQISPNLTPDQVAQIRSESRPRPPRDDAVPRLARQRAVRGDFGRSLEDQTSVSGQIWSRLPATLELTVTALLLGLADLDPDGRPRRRPARVEGRPRPDRGVRRRLRDPAVLARADPDPDLLGAVPQVGAAFAAAERRRERRSTAAASVDRLTHLVMPAVVLSFFYIATWSRYLRSSMVEVLVARLHAHRPREGDDASRAPSSCTGSATGSSRSRRCRPRAAVPLQRRPRGRDRLRLAGRRAVRLPARARLRLHERARRDDARRVPRDHRATCSPISSTPRSIRGSRAACAGSWPPDHERGDARGLGRPRGGRRHPLPPRARVLARVGAPALPGQGRRS